jgi:hypothetical protein
MAELTKSVLLTAFAEWGEYVSRFGQLSPDEGAAFLKFQGYVSLKDLLAHISVWWEEAESIIHATIARRERQRRNYDFGAFNAEAVARFKSMPEAELLDWFESMREKRCVSFHYRAGPELLRASHRRACQSPAVRVIERKRVSGPADLFKVMQEEAFQHGRMWRIQIP